MKLQKCPDCGAAPEFHWKDYTFGSCSGALKCPYDHYRVNLNGPAGSRAQAEKKLAPQWIELVEKISQGKTA